MNPSFGRHPSSPTPPVSSPTAGALGYLPDLDKSSSARKAKQQGRLNEKGTNVRNYHRCLTEILSSLVRCQRDEQDPFYAYVRMGDQIKHVRVVVCVCLVLGDGKSGDMLVARNGGYACARFPDCASLPSDRFLTPCGSARSSTWGT